MKTIQATLIAFGTLFTAQVMAGPVNINAADASVLDQELNGVGPVIAQRIVDYRDANGHFQAAEELMLVKGIGEKTFSKNAEDILLK